MPSHLNNHTPLRVDICSSRTALRAAFRAKNRRIYSCLNGFTLRTLLLEQAYDDLIALGRIAFVVDGVLALAHLRRVGVRAERICGRDLLDEAMTLHAGPVTVIGGLDKQYSPMLHSLQDYLGRDVSLLTAPIFRSLSELYEFARTVGPGIAADSLIVVCIRSPLQDILSGALCAYLPRALFINVGAVLDDIAAKRLRSVRLFSSLGMEWLYRLAVSPRRTWPKIAAMLQRRLALDNGRYRWQEL